MTQDYLHQQAYFAEVSAEDLGRILGTFQKGRFERRDKGNPNAYAARSTLGDSDQYAILVERHPEQMSGFDTTVLFVSRSSNYNGTLADMFTAQTGVSLVGIDGRIPEDPLFALQARGRDLFQEAFN